MKPKNLNKASLIKKARYWNRYYKEIRKFLRNHKMPVSDKAIALT